jgi:hypothetical protein
MDEKLKCVGIPFPGITNFCQKEMKSYVQRKRELNSQKLGKKPQVISCNIIVNVLISNNILVGQTLHDYEEKVLIIEWKG